MTAPRQSIEANMPLEDLQAEISLTLQNCTAGVIGEKEHDLAVGHTEMKRRELRCMRSSCSASPWVIDLLPAAMAKKGSSVSFQLIAMCLPLGMLGCFLGFHCRLSESLLLMLGR